MEETGQVSVTEPIGEAMDWMQDRLFHPFRLGDWFVYGFAWFIAGLAKPGGFSGSFNAGDEFDGGTTPSGTPEQVLNSLSGTELLIGFVLLVVVLGLMVLFLWLGSRGSFIFLDSTLRDAAAITEPWSEYSKLGNSLFRVRLVFILLIGVMVLLLIAVFALFAVLQTQFGDAAGPAGAVFIVVLSAGMTGIFLLFSVLYQLLDDFVVQVMYLRDMYCWEACKLFWNDLLSQYPGTFLLFYLMKVLLYLLAGVIILIGGCMTLCIGCILVAIPYVGSVVLLPVGVFFRTYSIRMLEQFGDEWAVDVRDEQVAELF